MYMGWWVIRLYDNHTPMEIELPISNLNRLSWCVGYIILMLMDYFGSDGEAFEFIIIIIKSMYDSNMGNSVKGSYK